jgi:5-methylcytosine-specific restriction enzyme A
MADWPYCTAAWRKLRLAKLAREPLCQPCKARDHLTSANTVDHIKPIAEGGEAFPPLTGLMSMCERCHNEKTAANDRTHTKPFARKIKGVDAAGNPVDPGDGWHGGGGSNHQNGAGRGPMWESERYLVSGQAADTIDDFGFA